MALKVKFYWDKYIFFIVTVAIMAGCLALIVFYSGFQHEGMKLKSMGLHLFMVVLALFLISDTIKFVLLAIDKATWPGTESKYRSVNQPKMHTRTDYLKLRLRTLKAQLRYGQNHLNEPLNLHFKLISVDLCLYALYFMMLTSVVLVTRDGLLYHNTAVMTKIFLTNRSYTMGLNSIFEFDQFYTFVELTMINAFDVTLEETGSHSWIYGDQVAKLGVARLRQLRRKERHHLGWGSSEYSSRNYMPKWKLPYERMAYTDKYWKIYSPWLPSSVKYSFYDKFFMSLIYNHRGFYQSYPESAGYLTNLARTRNNSMKVIDYLQDNNWVTKDTAAVFIDFTLYNADANIFSICTLLLEQSPFGTMMASVEVDSMKMHLLDELGTVGFIIYTCYILVLIQFAKSLVVTLWFEPSKLRSMWNKLDLVILVFNVVVVVLIVVQESMVNGLLEQIEYANKMQFIDFRHPAVVKKFCNIVQGVLVMMTTLRLWKVLQFANVFELFSHALYSAWQALASTALIIVIFLIGFATAVAIINGNNSSNFNSTMRAIANSMCFSFGFSSHITPIDLFYGGRVMGIVLYLILAFVISQLLINVFVSTINGYFNYAKVMRDAQAKQPIDFLQFLRIEYYAVFQLFKKLPGFNRGYRRHNRTVADNIKHFLDVRQRTGIKRHRLIALANVDLLADEDLDEATKQEKYRERIARLYNIATVMQTQMQLLEHLWKNDRPIKVGDSERPSQDSTESSSEDEYVA
ncbi:hypothetical protein KR044_013088 [Drosophila immigrans]|nr:hypothetical protein KR044_013088 [Drosophila immigrans]